MGLKIKWNDDRVRGAMTAILVIGRDRLYRGKPDDLIREALAEYRDDPEAYKARKATWADARTPGPLTQRQQIEYYTRLIAAIDRLLEKMEQAKRQFNSLLELDNALIAYLKDVR